MKFRTVAGIGMLIGAAGVLSYSKGCLDLTRTNQGFGIGIGSHGSGIGVSLGVTYGNNIPSNSIVPYAAAGALNGNGSGMNFKPYAGSDDLSIKRFEQMLQHAKELQSLGLSAENEASLSHAINRSMQKLHQQRKDRELSLHIFSALHPERGAYQFSDPDLQLIYENSEKNE